MVEVLIKLSLLNSRPYSSRSASVEIQVKTWILTIKRWHIFQFVWALGQILCFHLSQQDSTAQVLARSKNLLNLVGSKLFCRCRQTAATLHAPIWCHKYDVNARVVNGRIAGAPKYLHSFWWFALSLWSVIKADPLLFDVYNKDYNWISDLEGWTFVSQYLSVNWEKTKLLRTP